MIKYLYVVKFEGQTFCYTEDSLKQTELVDKTDTEKDPKKVRKIKLDTREAVESNLPNGDWKRVELVDDYLGKHEANVERVLAKPKTDDLPEYQALPNSQKPKYIDDVRLTRFEDVVIATSVISWDFDNPITEEGVSELPLCVKKCLANLCVNRYLNGLHPGFF